MLLLCSSVQNISQRLLHLKPLTALLEYTHTHTHTHTHMHAHAHNTRTHTHACTHAYTHTHAHMYTHTTHAHTHACTHAYTHAHMYTYTQRQHTHTRAHTHTHSTKEWARVCVYAILNIVQFITYVTNAHVLSYIFTAFLISSFANNFHSSGIYKLQL